MINGNIPMEGADRAEQAIALALYSVVESLKHRGPENDTHYLRPNPLELLATWLAW